MEAGKKKTIFSPTTNLQLPFSKLEEPHETPTHLPLNGHPHPARLPVRVHPFQMEE
jgi:hypothetical protein